MSIRRNRLTSVLFALLLFGAVGTRVFGHDTWLIPDQFTLRKGEGSITLDLTSGLAFPTLETAIKPERLEEAKIRLADQTSDLTDFQPAANSLRCVAQVGGSGVATLWIRLKPRTLELTPAQVREYLDEIAAPAAIRERWDKAVMPKHWRESYTKYAKTFVQVGDSAADRSWSKPVGLVLEIVPENDPTTLRAGDTLTVRVLKNGMPLPDFPLGIVGGIPESLEFRRTDPNGRVTFRPVKPGRWLLRGTVLRASAQSNLDWESDFTTLTIEVKDR